MAELQELATSAGIVVHDKIIQRRPAIDPRTVLGRGKLDELLIRSLQLGADMLVFDRELTPAQVRSLSEATDLKIIDRSQLILDIFAQRAQSSEGKIQVELAQLKYLLPRLIAGQDSAFSRLAGGIGGRGPGETKLEMDRRRVRDRINRLEKEIETQRLRRQERRKVQNEKPASGCFDCWLYQRRQIDAAQCADKQRGPRRTAYVCDARPDFAETETAARTGNHY